MTASSTDIFDEVAYLYDGSLEGMLSAIFASYAKGERPTDVACEAHFSPRLSQRIEYIETDGEHAERVRKSITQKCGRHAWRAVLKASLSGAAGAAYAAYRFVRYAFDGPPVSCAKCRSKNTCPFREKSRACPKHTKGAFNHITHPDVEPLFKVARSVDQEAEHMRQFARFEHIQEPGMNIWFARINPRDSVIPLVMNHFIERFNIQPFMIYDEVHDLVGLYDGTGPQFIIPEEDAAIKTLKASNAHEVEIQDAWKRFYKTLSIDERYNPELRRHFMPMRLWKNITELQEDLPSLRR